MIDQLTQVHDLDQLGIGYISQNATDRFVAIDDPYSPRATHINSKAFRAIVRMGASAIPTLLNHLTDRRPTKLVNSALSVVGGKIAFGDYYSPRSMLPGLAGIHAIPNNSSPWGYEIPSGKDEFVRYRFCVGDICYAAIGQMVGRNLLIRYVSNQTEVVNSPAHSPELADAIRKDWAGANSDDLKQMLSNDVFSYEEDPQIYIEYPDSKMEYGALQRLCYYFPDSGLALVIQMLSRPIYDEQIIEGFVGRLFDGSLAFNDTDITNPFLVYKTLHEPSTPIGRYLAALFERTNIDDESYSQSTLADQLNILMSDPFLYDKDAWSGITLRPETVQLMSPQPWSQDQRYFNRLLIEDTLAGAVKQFKGQPSNDPSTWRPMFQKFSDRYGPDYADRAKVMLYGHHLVTDDSLAQQIFRTLCPGYDPHAPTMLKTTSSVEQYFILRSLSWFRSKELDAFAERVLASMNCTRPWNTLNDGYALVCLKRLARAGGSCKYVFFCRQRIDILTPHSSEYYISNDIKQYKAILASLACQ